MRVLVCGGRHFDDRDMVLRELDAIHRETPIAWIIHGGATGADSLAGYWAKSRKVAEVVYPANWHGLGRPAGPIRNESMLADSEPDLVLAFPGGNGTADMTRRSWNAGVPVKQVGPQVNRDE